MQNELEQKTAKRRAKRLKRKVRCHMHRAEFVAESITALNTLQTNILPLQASLHL